MAKYLAKRLAQSLIAILGITVVVFVILHLTGDPVELMVSPTTSREQMDICVRRWASTIRCPSSICAF